MMRIFLINFLLFFWSLTIASQGIAEVSNSGKLMDAIVAVVNSDIITRNELDNHVKLIMQQMQARQVGIPPSDILRKQVLEQMILELVELQAAAEQALIVDDNTLDAAMAQIAAQNQVTLPQLLTDLEHQQVSPASFQETLRKDILLKRLRQHVIDDKIQISEAEINRYIDILDNAAAQRIGQEEVHLSQILIRVPENASSEQWQNARQRAEEVMRQLHAGGNFAELAAAHSDAPDALQGGDLGWRVIDSLPTIFIKALRLLQRHQVSSVLQSPLGLHIFKLNDHRILSAAQAFPVVLQTHARHILIKVTPTVTAEAAQRRLLDFKTQIEHKMASFEALARAYSDDSSASKSGDLGWVYPSDMVPDFEHAMNALSIDEISQPVSTPFGYHLIQVLERKEDNISKERRRLAARHILHARKRDEALNEWWRSLRDSAYVEYREVNE